MKLHWLFRQYMAPAGDGGGGGGAAVDRGDDFVPTEDEDDDDKATKKEAPEPKLDELKTEEEKAAEKEAEAKGEKKDTRIPASRHKAILDKQREEARVERERLVEENRLLKAGQQLAAVSKAVGEDETKLAALEEKLEKHRVDGETDKAVVVAREIRILERSINEKTNELRLQAATSQAVETVRYDMTMTRIEEAYPSLNEDDKENYDKAKAAEVIELRDAFKLKGLPPSMALQKAVKYVMGAPTTRAETRAVEVEAKVDPAEVEKQRKKDAVAKTADAVGKQPPNLGKVGADHDKAGGARTELTAKQVIKMSQAEFAKLDPETIARLRGDTVEES